MVEVVSFGFAPMKGTRHVPQKDAVLTSRGALGDRSLCLVDLEQQKVVRTVAYPQLMAVQVAWDDGELRVSMPEKPVLVSRPQVINSLVCDYWGRNVKLQVLQTSANELFSNYLGKPVVLALAETGDIIFGAPYSLAGTASLAYLARRLRRPELVNEHARLRSTFLVKTSEPFEEDTWAGQTIELVAGEGTPSSLTGVRLKIGEDIGRCAVIDSNPATGEKDLALFKELATFRPRKERGEPTLGVFAELVLEP